MWLPLSPKVNYFPLDVHKLQPEPCHTCGSVVSTVLRRLWGHHPRESRLLETPLPAAHCIPVDRPTPVEKTPEFLTGCGQHILRLRSFLHFPRSKLSRESMVDDSGFFLAFPWRNCRIHHVTCRLGSLGGPKLPCLQLHIESPADRSPSSPFYPAPGNRNLIPRCEKKHPDKINGLPVGLDDR